MNTTAMTLRQNWLAQGGDPALLLLTPDTPLDAAALAAYGLFLLNTAHEMQAAPAVVVISEVPHGPQT